MSQMVDVRGFYIFRYSFQSGWVVKEMLYPKTTFNPKWNIGNEQDYT